MDGDSPGIQEQWLPASLGMSHQEGWKGVATVPPCLPMSSRFLFLPLCGPLPLSVCSPAHLSVTLLHSCPGRVDLDFHAIPMHSFKVAELSKSECARV